MSFGFLCLFPHEYQVRVGVFPVHSSLRWDMLFDSLTCIHDVSYSKKKLRAEDKALLIAG